MDISGSAVFTERRSCSYRSVKGPPEQELCGLTQRAQKRARLRAAEAFSFPLLLLRRAPAPSFRYAASSCIRVVVAGPALVAFDVGGGGGGSGEWWDWEQDPKREPAADRCSLSLSLSLSLSRSLARSMSSELLWQLVKKHNRFIVKRNGVTLSSEPNNLMNKNSFKFSGLVHAKTVGVNPSAKGHKGVELVLKASKKSQQFRPAQAHKVTVLKKGIRYVAWLL